MKGNQNGRIRYDDDFKQGALKMIVEQKMPMKQVSEELGVSMDSLRHWLKKSGLNPAPENRGNLQNKKIHALESELKSLRKELEKKDEIITILKKINRHNLQSLTDKHDFIDNNRAGHSVSTLCRILDVSKSDYYAAKNRQK